jgi:hypothetical protein
MLPNSSYSNIFIFNKYGYASYPPNILGRRGNNGNNEMFVQFILGTLDIGDILTLADLLAYLCTTNIVHMIYIYTVFKIYYYKIPFVNYIIAKSSVKYAINQYRVVNVVTQRKCLFGHNNENLDGLRIIFNNKIDTYSSYL